MFSKLIQLMALSEFVAYWTVELLPHSYTHTYAISYDPSLARLILGRLVIVQIALLHLPQGVRDFLTVFVLFHLGIWQTYGEQYQVQLPSCRGTQLGISCLVCPRQCKGNGSSYLCAAAFCGKRPGWVQGENKAS